MKFYDNIATAADETRDWIIFNKANLPENLVSLTRTGASPVDLVVNFAETIYANMDALEDSEALEIAAAGAVLCDQFGFHGMTLNARGSKIASILRGGTPESPPEPRLDLVFPE